MAEEGFTNMVKYNQFEMLKLIQEGHSISQIAQIRKVSRVALYKTLKVLNNKGLIRNPKRSIYELTDKGIEGLHQFVAFRYKLRQHNLSFKIEVLESPKNWDLKRNEIRQLPYFNKTIKLKNNEQDILNYGRLMIKTTSKSIIIKMPTLYSSDWESAVIQAMSILETTIYKIEKLLNVRLIKEYKSNIKIISQEYAKIQDAIAKLYRNEGNRIYLTGEDGKIWLITDFSFSTDELEFIHPEKATDDLDAIAPSFNFLRKNPKFLTNMDDRLNKIVYVQEMEAHNVVKHQSVLDDMKRTQLEILDAFRKINDRLDKAGL